MSTSCIRLLFGVYLLPGATVIIMTPHVEYILFNMILFEKISRFSIIEMWLMYCQLDIYNNIQIDTYIFFLAIDVI